MPAHLVVPLVHQDLMVRVVLKENQVMLDLMVHLDHLVPQVAHLDKRDNKVQEYKDQKVPLDPMVPQDQRVKTVHQEDHLVHQDLLVMLEMLVLKVLLD